VSYIHQNGETWLGRLFSLPRTRIRIRAECDLEIARERSEAAILRRVHPLELAPAALEHKKHKFSLPFPTALATLQRSK